MKCPYCEPDDPKCPGRGVCHCGCGEYTKTHRKSIAWRGVTAGEPCQYVQGHRFSSPTKKTPPLSMAEIKALGG